MTETLEKLDPKTDGSSMDIVQSLIDQLRPIVPEAFTEDKIDFEVLRELLGDGVDDRPERYSFDWHGKAIARRIAQKPSTGTLRPCPEKSLNWNTTQNVFIEGDNLEVLKLLQKSYHKRVKMIYIDPPYNTGNEFIYPDKYQDNLETYLKYTGQISDEGFKVSSNSESSGRYHTNWLNMIYPRLKLARNLLTDDGVIVISIDDHEAANLKRIADEVFGEENFVAQLVWAGGRKNDSKLVSESHEYMLVYVRDREYLKATKVTWRIRKKGLDDIYKAYAKLKKKFGDDFAAISEGLKKWFKSLPDGDPAKRQKHYSQVDERGIYFPDNISWPGGGGPKYEVLHPDTGKPVNIPSRGWMFADPKKMKTIIADNRVHFGDDENSVPCIKSYLKDREQEVIYSVFYQDGRAATKRLRSLMGSDVFDHPKDELVLAEIIEACTNDGDLILDFFAGSCSSAHACLLVDQKQKTSRKFIMVQLQEPCDTSNRAGKNAIAAGYKTIADIGRARICKAFEAVEREHSDGDGIRCFSLDSSNIISWDADSDSLEATLHEATQSIKDERTEDDVLFELIVKFGLNLSMPVERRELNGSTVFVIGNGALFACLGESIDLLLVEHIVELAKEFSPEITRVVLRDDAIPDDVVKTNAIQILNQAGVNEVQTI